MVHVSYGISTDVRSLETDRQDCVEPWCWLLIYQASENSVDFIPFRDVWGNANLVHKWLSNVLNSHRIK